MPKLNLASAIRIKNSSGEILKLKGNGFEWNFVGSGGSPVDMLFADLSTMVVHGGHVVTISDLSVMLVHGASAGHVTIQDLSSAVVF